MSDEDVSHAHLAGHQLMVENSHISMHANVHVNVHGATLSPAYLPLHMHGQLS